ncbi:MAG TPA: hypothetical protein VGI10_05040 [Polyangiaceae bacterium]
MPERSRTTKKIKKPPRDPNRAARRVLDAVIAATEGEPAKNPAAVALGRMGGLKGGKARAEGMTAKQRTASAKKAAKARWGT